MSASTSLGPYVTLPRSAGKTAHKRKNVACEEVREEKSAGSPGVWWSPGVGANGDACQHRARPRHAPSRDRRSRVRPHITRGLHSCIPCGSKATLIEWRTVHLLYCGDNSRVYEADQGVGCTCNTQDRLQRVVPKAREWVWKSVPWYCPFLFLLNTTLKLWRAFVKLHYVASSLRSVVAGRPRLGKDAASPANESTL